MKDKVAVVVPIYTNRLTKKEQVSLRQLQKVLGGYPRIFVTPQSLRIEIGALGDGFQIERFDDAWFRGVVSYSMLMLQPDFYERFRDYEYILIYQLDAFVFADRLSAFCGREYDYIGAPVRGPGPWDVLGTRVGNGGLSLRRVAACKLVAESFARMPDGHPLKDLFLPCEDTFFAYCGLRTDIAFRVAPVREALEFSVQDDVQHVHRRLADGWRPFGCHGWDKYDPDVWQPIIEAASGVSLGPPLKLLLGRGRRFIPNWQVRIEKLRQRRFVMPVWRLYGLIRRGDVSAALGLVAGWLGSCSEENSIWSDMLQDFEYLYRLSLWHSSRWRDAAVSVGEEDTAVGVLLRQALLECVRRCLISTGCTRDKAGMVLLLLEIVKRQHEDGILYGSLRDDAEKARILLERSWRKI